MYYSIKRFRVEFPQLIQAAVPTIEVFLEIYEVDSHFFNKFQIVLTLIDLQFVVRQMIQIVVFQDLRKEALLLIPLLLYNLEYYFTNLVYELVRVLTTMVLGML